MSITHSYSSSSDEPQEKKRCTSTAASVFPGIYVRAAFVFFLVPAALLGASRRGLQGACAACNTRRSQGATPLASPVALRAVDTGPLQ